ncbi:MAG: GTPase [Pseudomonadota bacterium]
MTVRSLAAILVGLLVLLLMIALMMSADLLLSVWERLREVGPWAPPAFAAVMVLFGGAGTLVGIRLLRGPTRSQPPSPSVVDAETLRERIDHADQRGVAIGTAQAELRRLDQRKDSGEVYLAMFGGASAGKSSLIEALLPQHDLTAGVTLGTTRRIAHYAGDRGGRPIQLADVPGFGHAATKDLMDAARDEAIRAHLVIYVADGDLDRHDGEELKRLAGYGKPVIVALNKSDRYTAEELAALSERLAERSGADIASIVTVSAGGEEQVLLQEGGNEKLITRQRPAQVDALWLAVDRQLSRQELEGERERSSLKLASEKLQRAEADQRSEAGQALTEKYARRAVIGALAAITPGSDLVIQAALATRFLRELGELYEIPVREIEIDRFLTLAGDRLKKTTALVLAVTGNAFKAFPGIGTLTGGVIHAAAYGMIFDSLGRSICASLEERKSLDPVWAADRFEKQLDESVEEKALGYARLALTRWKAENRDD